MIHFNNNANVIDILTSPELMSFMDFGFWLVMISTVLVLAIGAIADLTNWMKTYEIEEDDMEEIIACEEEPEQQLVVETLRLHVPESNGYYCAEARRTTLDEDEEDYVEDAWSVEDDNYNGQTQAEYTLSQGQGDVEVYEASCDLDYDWRMDDVYLPENRIEQMAMQWFGIDSVISAQLALVAMVLVTVGYTMPTLSFVDDVIGAPARIKSMENEITELRSQLAQSKVKSVHDETKEVLDMLLDNEILAMEPTDAPSPKNLA